MAKKKAPAKKATTKKAPAKKATTKKVPAKKAATSAVKKKPVTVVKKAAPKKPAAKKAVAKKPVAKKAVLKKVTKPKAIKKPVALATPVPPVDLVTPVAEVAAPAALIPGGSLSFDSYNPNPPFPITETVVTGTCTDTTSDDIAWAITLNGNPVAGGSGNATPTGRTTFSVTIPADTLTTGVANYELKATKTDVDSAVLSLDTTTS